MIGMLLSLSCGNGLDSHWISLDSNRDGSLRARDRPIQGVALHRLPACFADQPHQLLPAKSLRSGRPGVVVNLLLDHRSIQIVVSETLRDLRDLGAQHLPVGLDMDE